jgi:hypothetical protein
MGVRAVIEPLDSGHAIGLGPAWRRRCAIAPGDTVGVDLFSEGPQRDGLADDLAEALRSAILALWGFAAPTEPSLRPVGVDAGTPIYELVEPERPTGFEELPSALNVSAQAATSLLRGPDVALTRLGEWLHLSLRLVGPVLLGSPCCRSGAE